MGRWMMFRFLTEVFPSDEIGQLFDGEDIADGLVLSWGFAEEEGFACADSSGNGNEGSLVGYPAGEVSNWVEGKSAAP